MRIVAVMSGKGGVGKTTTTVGISLALKELGFRPAMLDLDIENPSMAGRDGVTGLTRADLSFPGDLIVPPRWADIPVMSLSMLPPDDFEDTPAMIKEGQKHLIIRHLVQEVDWGDTEVLVVDMPPGSGEEVRGLLQLNLDGAVIVTSPQRISEAAVRKVLMMAEEYRIPVLGLVENTPNGIPGEAGLRLADQFGVEILAQVPWTEDILISMEDHEPFNCGPFMPVAEAVAGTVLAPVAATRTKGTPSESGGRYLLDPTESVTTVTQPEGNGAGEEAPPWRQFAELTDDEWETLKFLLPEHMRNNRRGGANRNLLNGILWYYTTGGRWDAMPARFGNHHTAKTRVRRWREQGLWPAILQQAREFGYALTEGDFRDDEGEATNHHEAVLSNGDDSGQQAWPGSESPGEVSSGSPAERAD